MARRKSNDSIQITSVNQCLHEFDLLKEALSVEETEDNWQIIDSNLTRFTAAVRGGACDYPEEFIKRWKETEIVRGLVSAMSTERTRLSGTALDLVAATSQLGNYWDSAVPFYAPTIVKLLGRASKIYITRATNTLNLLIKGSKTLAFMPYLIDGISEKSPTIRIGCAEALLCCLSEALIDNDPSDSNRPRSKSKDVSTKRLNDIENVIKIGGRDRDPKVRTIIKRIWELYEQKWPTRAASLAQPFTPTIKRYLGISHSSTQASSMHATSAPSGKLHTSQSASQDANQTQQKSLIKGHQRTGSKNAADSHLPPPSTKNATHNSSKSIKSHNSHISFPKSGDLAILQKAMMVPLPRDEPEHQEPTVASSSARAKVMSARTRTPVEGSIHQAPQSGPTLKRSNSTMRAQRVPLSSHTDLPAGGVNGSTWAPARVPFQSIQSAGHPSKDTKPHTNPLKSGHLESSLKPGLSSTSTNPLKTTFKPTRVPSNTTQPDSKPLTQPNTTLPTRPLARRVVKEAPSDQVVTAPSISNALHVSVRSNTHSRKAPAEQELPIIKPTRKVFKPTKPSVKSSSGLDLGSSKSSSTKTVPVSSMVPAAPCHPVNAPLQALKVPITLEELPEGLRLPASIPLPCSPSPPPVILASSTLPSESLPSSERAPVSDPPPLPLPTSPPPKEPMLTLSPPTLLPSSSPLLCQEVIKIDQNATATSKNHTTSLNLKFDNRTEVVSQPLKPLLKPLSSSLPNFGTPGPKICRVLPDDLIVPMSVPLPPSPNSPFPQLNLRTRRTPLIDRRTPRTKSYRSHSSPRPRPVGSSSSSSATVVAPTGETNNEHLRQHPSSSKLSTVASHSQSDKEIDEYAGQQQIAPEGILVDFDHEDTIWVPRPPALHEDLLQLNSALGVDAKIPEEIDDGEDGPQEKRQRLGQEGGITKQSPASSAPNSERESNTPRCKSPTSHNHARPLRRDPSMFHWDLPHLENNANPDDSDDKTISCLKEQPPFLPSDVSVNDSISFHHHFFPSLHHSTPASNSILLNKSSVPHSSP